jgi:hypothetical protein
MNYITRSGSTLMNGTSIFRFAGCNCFWLGLLWPAQESAARYPTNSEIDDALQTAVEMGASVIRSHTLGISVGNSLSIEPSLGVFNDAAFAPIDYTIKRCNDLGLRMIIPLTDNYHYYHGGKSTFTTWRGISDETQFYTNSQVIADFEAYISHLLNHVSTLSGVALKNDPAILAWETGNELGNPTPPTSWTTIIANYLKSIDSNHIVIDGSYGVNSAALSIANVDIYSNHVYPLQISQIASDASTANAAGKAYLIGEIDWRPYASSGSGAMYLDTITAYAGAASAKVVVNRPDAYPYHVQFRQAGLSLIQGTSYTLSFAAKADEARNLQIAVIGGAAPYPVYFQPADFLIGTSWQVYNFTFTMNKASDANAVLNFDVAQVVSSVWIDCVSLIPAGGTSLIVNGDMEAGSLSPWTMHNTTVTPDSLSAFESSVESNAAISGDLFWCLMPHRDSYGFALQNDGFSLYYPGQESGAQANAQTLRTHAYTMSGLAVSSALVPAAPALNAITKASGVYSVSWRGAVGAETYALEQSTSGTSGPWVVLGSAYTDFSTPVSVPALSQCWYRVRAANVSGVYGPYSEVVGGPD